MAETHFCCCLLVCQSLKCQNKVATQRAIGAPQFYCVPYYFTTCGLHEFTALMFSLYYDLSKTMLFCHCLKGTVLHQLLLRCQPSQRVDYPQWMSNGHERNKEQSVTPVFLVYLKRVNGNNQIHCVHINHEINQRNAKKTSI